MKIIMCTAAVCLLIGVSIFTTQRTIETEGRRTRSSMPGVLSNPLGDGESLVTRVDRLNANLTAINNRLTRLEEISNRKNKVDNSELKSISSEINEDVGRMTARLNAISKEQFALRDLPSQLQTIDHNMRIILLAKDESTKQSPPPQEIIKTLDWMVQKIDDIDSYFPPLYDFLGAVYESPALDGYPSIDKRLNEVIMQLDEMQKEVTTTLKHVSPYVIEPTRRRNDK